jgi:hypothetical protein
VSKSETSISIICVYNRLLVRQQCLDRSIGALPDEAGDVEFIPIENVDHAYASAGAALNHGVSLAKNDVMVFAHQDVYLHSLTALKRAAGQMQSEGFGALGAVGRGADGRLMGRIRDRVVLAGEPVERLTPVDTLDEVLFMAPRRQLLEEPLAELPDLAWHAYAVEYGLRMRRKGRGTGVADIPLTHNSRSINLEGLDVAHQAVAKIYPEFLPVRTTCGTITNRRAEENRRVWLSSQRWRYRWLRNSVVLQGSRTAADGMTAVLIDLRTDVDGAIERAPGRRLNIINRSGGSSFTPGEQKPLELARGEGTIIFSDADISRIPAVVASGPAGAWTLITNLSEPDVRLLEKSVVLNSAILGFQHDTGLWLLLGPSLAELPGSWRSSKATPLAPRAIVGAFRSVGTEVLFSAVTSYRACVAELTS